MLQFEEVEKRYVAQVPVVALRGVTTSIATGEYVAIVGPSGSGKTTLLNIAGCIDRPTSGRYSFDGRDTSKLSNTERAQLRSSGIGFVFQAYHLLAGRSVVDNVSLPLIYRRVARTERRRRALAALDMVGLVERERDLPNHLSGGERQRVAIARAVAQGARVLLCDEPTGNVDTETADEIMDHLEQLNNNGTTLVIVTHDSRIWKRSRRTLRISDGTVHPG